MAMVDMVITTNWFSDRKSRSVNNLPAGGIGPSIIGFPPGVSRSEKTNQRPGQISQFYPPAIVMPPRVGNMFTK